MRGMGNPPTTNFMLQSIILALLVVASAAGPSAATTTTTAAATLDEMTHSVDRWFEKLSQQKAATLTKLQVYIHADFNTASPNQTVFQVASAEITPHSSSNFGWILAIDNPLTIGGDHGSQGLGHYQGMNGYSDLNVAAATMGMNMIFCGGEYDGSTISILGRQPVLEEVRVMSVISGSGAFRFAKGIVLASTYSTDPQTQTGIYVYVMYILTPPVGSVQTA